MSAVPSWKGAAWAAGAAALLGWWLAPQPEPAAALVKPRSDGWVLPDLPRIVDQTSLAAKLLGAPYWGGPLAAAAPEGPPPDARWRIAGIYGRGAEGGVLVLFAAEGKPAQRLRVGEALPSGHRIERIEENQVCVRIGQRLYRLGVERSVK